jgi:hypothetical protein
MFIYSKSPKVLHRLLWNVDTKLHSNTRVFYIPTTNQALCNEAIWLSTCVDQRMVTHTTPARQRQVKHGLTTCFRGNKHYERHYRDNQQNNRGELTSRHGGLYSVLYLSSIYEYKCKCSFVQHTLSPKVLHRLLWNFTQRCIWIRACFKIPTII